MVVLLNLLLYRNSFCGIFRQASVLRASCCSASFQGMEVVKGSNKKKKADPRQGCNTGCCFQLAVESLRLPYRSYRRSRDVFLSLCACFSLYLPWKSNVRECSCLPGAFPGAAGGVGWRRAAWERPCPYPSLPFPLGILRPCAETRESWSKVGWGGASTEALGFHSAFPRRNTPRMWALHPKEPRSVASSIPMAAGKPKDSDKALFCGRTCCCSSPPGFRRSQVNCLAGWTPSPQTLWKYKGK